ncbi:MauE/DoxX family redox-associated membrane protein [Nonomuraea sp. NPDC049400]|uniref:MauE/DoxX family redox-associated membrane protein n=1 Tax=Nonomuraea sp. NPDC049400 TaxID=3364352 RepID=UPI0037AD82B9
MDHVSIACRGLIGVVFLLSAASKITSRAAAVEFFGVIRRLLRIFAGQPWATRSATKATGFAVISMELAVPFALAIPSLARLGFGTALVALLMFSCAIAAAIHRGVRMSCACFGRSTTPLGVPHLVRNGILSVAAITGLVLGAGRPVTASPQALLVPVLAALVTALVLIRFDDLVDLFKPRARL